MRGPREGEAFANFCSKKRCATSVLAASSSRAALGATEGPSNFLLNHEQLSAQELLAFRGPPRGKLQQVAHQKSQLLPSISPAPERFASPTWHSPSSTRPQGARPRGQLEAVAPRPRRPGRRAARRRPRRRRPRPRRRLRPRGPRQGRDIKPDNPELPRPAPGRSRALSGAPARVPGTGARLREGPKLSQAVTQKKSGQAPASEGPNWATVKEILTTGRRPPPRG